MSLDIATLGIAVDSTEVEKGGQALDKLAESGANAESSVTSLASASRTTASAISGNKSAIDSMASAINDNTNAIRNNGTVVATHTTSQQNLANTTTRTSAATEHYTEQVHALFNQIFPLAAAQDRITIQIQQVNDAYRNGAISAQEYIGAITVLSQRYNDLNTAQQRSISGITATSSGLSQAGHGAREAEIGYRGLLAASNELREEISSLFEGNFSLLNLFGIFVHINEALRESRFASWFGGAKEGAVAAVAANDNVIASNVALVASNDEVTASNLRKAVAETQGGATATVATTPVAAVAPVADTSAIADSAAAEDTATTSAQALAAANTEVAETATAAASAQGDLAAASTASAASATEAATASQAQAASALEAGAASRGATGAVDDLGAAATGAGVAGEGMGESIAGAATAGAGALAPLTVALVAIAAAAGVVVGSFAIWSTNIRNNVGDVTNQMKLTGDQLEHLKQQGTDTGVTLQDTFRATEEVIVERLQNAFSGPLAGISQEFHNVFNSISEGLLDYVHIYVGTMSGAYAAIVNIWHNFPAIMRDIGSMAANAVISVIEAMVNRVIASINGLFSRINSLRNAIPGADALGLPSAPTIGNVNLGRVQGTGAVGNAVRAGVVGYERGVGAVDEFGREVQGRATRIARDRVTDAAGTPHYDDGPRDHKTREPHGRGGHGRSGGSDEDDRATEQATRAAQQYITTLTQETEQIGKNRMEVHAMAVERAAAAAPTAALAAQIRQAGAAWVEATNTEATNAFNRSMHELNETQTRENSLLGMNAEQRAVANAQHEIDTRLKAQEALGIHINADAIQAETTAYIENARARGARQDAADNASHVADSVGRMNDQLHQATSSFSDLFGTAGSGFAQLVNTIGDYYQFQADQEKHLAEVRAQYTENSQEYQQAEIQARQENTAHELNSYGQVLGGIKNLFSQKSAAYKVMEGIEKAYAAVRLAIAIKDILTETLVTTAHVGGATARIATDAVETGTSVANSGIRATAHGIEAFAHTLASIPFPFNLLAGAAVLAALVAVGVKIAGGGHSASAASSSTDDSKTTTAPYPGPFDQYGQPTSSYSVLRPGSTIVGTGNGANDNGYSSVNMGNSSSSGGGTSIVFGDTHFTVQGNVDNDALPAIQQMLDDNRAETVEQARAAAAADRAASATRQRIGGA